MKEITHLILCNTKTPEGLKISPSQIIHLHTSSEEKGGYGWNRPGFDVLIGLDGTLYTIINEGNPTEVDLWEVSQGKKGIKGTFRYVAYVGGLTKSGKSRKDTLTADQEETLKAIVKYYAVRFPNITIVGFGELPNNEDELNPGFEVNEWLTAVGVPKKNQYISK